MHDIDDYPQAELVPGLVVYRYDAPLCFANAEDFRKRACKRSITTRSPSNGSSSMPRRTWRST